MNVQSGVIQKNIKTNRGTRNARGMLAAHAPNVPMSQCYNALARVTTVRESLIQVISAARKNARGAANVLVNVPQRNHKRICNATTRVTLRKEISTHRSNVLKTNATVVANALVHVRIGTSWRTTRRETKSRMSINLSMNVRSGVIPKNTKTNHGTRNAPGMLAAHALNVPMRTTRKTMRTTS
jgi:hypothetical protein